MLQRHQPFAPPPGEYHHFGAPSAGADEMVEAVIFRTPVSSRLPRWWSCCAGISLLLGSSALERGEEGSGEFVRAGELDRFLAMLNCVAPDLMSSKLGWMGTGGAKSFRSRREFC